MAGLVHIEWKANTLRFSYNVIQRDHLVDFICLLMYSR